MSRLSSLVFASSTSFAGPPKLRVVAVALAAAALFLSPTMARAQAAPAAPAGGGGTTSTTVVPVFPGSVAPTPPGQVLGGGSIESSSSRPKMPGERDNFDLLPNSGSGGTVFGNERGSVMFGGERLRNGRVPEVHVVQKGDTLWDLCDRFFQNPYQWPRVWSFNPQIQNPHWIYPGDPVRLRPLVAPTLAATGAGANVPQGPSIIDKRRQVPPDTIFLRDQGFVDDAADENWGEISGAPEDKMFLTDTDEVYLRLDPTREIRIGQELTIFRYARPVQGGKLVQLHGTVRINEWNPKTGVARAVVTETLDVIERGARVGPVGRRFTVVPPTRNDVDVDAQVLTSLYPHVFYGQHQLVFLNKGEKDGLKAGNRLQIVRKGDAWGESLATPNAATRIALENPSPAAVERVPTPRNPKALPEESVAELRVVFVREHTAAAIVIMSEREIEVGDKARMRKGF